MIKVLVKQGNSFAVVPEKCILQAMRIEHEEPLEVSLEGKSLILKPSAVSDRDRGRRDFKVKRLTRHGNSAALVIEKPLLKILGISPGDTLEVATNRVLKKPVLARSAQNCFLSLGGERNKERVVGALIGAGLRPLRLRFQEATLSPTLPPPRGREIIFQQPANGKRLRITPAPGKAPTTKPRLLPKFKSITHPSA